MLTPYCKFVTIDFGNVHIYKNKENIFLMSNRFWNDEFDIVLL